MSLKVSMKTRAIKNTMRMDREIKNKLNEVPNPSSTQGLIQACSYPTILQ